ncbi:HAMP domain-containing sensor histidine kinase [Clostridium boliviensis]|uniref:histidine kinase n=1 Tax=Clostridium boliviensis TaxID=318465 RepID=A0ABU4GGK9_9CLOT|nr:HAMP domain-containing sensor histidine kinase [Clostridium boliviensis]MDW2796711.1 HAMP domain-containing sensor histidine kinase [Clostridium boliviensis]
MKNSYRKERQIKITGKFNKKRSLAIHWAVWFYILILISSVMAFGLIAYLELDMNGNDAIYMLAMMPCMGIIAGAALLKIISVLKLRMKKIMAGITSVTEGDLDVELDLNNSGEYKEMYENFNRMVRELKNTKSEMKNFMNDFSHEFKTPITSIHGFAELLLEENINEEDRKQYLQIILEESQRLASLSQNTLLLSKLDAQEILTDKKKFELDEQIKKCAILLFRQIEKKQIKLNMELAPVTYYGSAELLHQVWMNLISNAIKFTPTGGEITIKLISTGNQITIQISDTGIGMNEETTRLIFNKYYQEDSSHATAGFGLGLSIVKRVVDLCKGEIIVTSVPGKGSTFTVVL